METGDTYVGEGLHAGTGEGAMMGLGFDAAGEDDEGRIGDRGQGGGQRGRYEIGNKGK